MTDSFDGYLDRSFDNEFADVEGLNWLPWVGAGYRTSKSKTMVLGESIYVYGDGDEATRVRIADRSSLRKRHLSHAVHKKFESRYVRNFERAVFARRRPTEKQRKSLWGDVIYHNLVPRLLQSRKERPTNADYAEGWSTVLSLTRIAAAERCIVYGLEKPKIDSLVKVLSEAQICFRKASLPRVGIHTPVCITCDIEGSTLTFLFIRHPSSFFSWRTWSDVLGAAGITFATQTSIGGSAAAIETVPALAVHAIATQVSQPVAS